MRNAGLRKSALRGETDDNPEAEIADDTPALAADGPTPNTQSAAEMIAFLSAE